MLLVTALLLLSSVSLRRWRQGRCCWRLLMVVSLLLRAVPAGWLLYFSLLVRQAAGQQPLRVLRASFVGLLLCERPCKKTNWGKEV